RDIVQRAIDDAARISADIDSEHRIVMSDGSIKDVHLVMPAVKNQNGNLEYIGALTDVTATKNAFRQIEGLKDQLQRENVALREEVDAASMFEEIIGTSASLRVVLSRVSKVAPTDSAFPHPFRIVRPRKRRLHWRIAAETWPIRGGSGGHLVS